jgi:hypothetical protein
VPFFLRGKIIGAGKLIGKLVNPVEPQLMVAYALESESSDSMKSNRCDPFPEGINFFAFVIAKVIFSINNAPSLIEISPFL